MTIEIANQDRVTINRVCPHCEINILGHYFYVDLIPFKLREFDVILGMYWLTDYNAHIYFKWKKVTLESPDSLKVVFRGKQKDKILIIIQAKKLLLQGCEAYLAHIMDNQKEVPKLEEILVVNEFSNVFLDDLPGLPPDREIEFAIELAPGTEPVSKEPYRMSPVEIRELETQMEDLSDKGIIRSSVFQWGVPVFFVKKKDGSIRLCIDYK